MVAKLQKKTEKDNKNMKSTKKEYFFLINKKKRQA
jgi:hypothetical protein